LIRKRDIVISWIAEVLSWVPIMLGFIVGVVIAALIFGYQLGHRAILPTVSLPSQFVDEDD